MLTDNWDVTEIPLLHAGRVGVGSDGRAGSRAALNWALRECGLRGGDLLIVRAGVAGTLDSTSAEELSCPAEPGIDLRTIVSSADPVSALVEVSEQADLLVLGTNGKADLSRSVLGSVGQQVATRAQCPVVIVPAAEEARPVGSYPVVVGVSQTQAGRLALRRAVSEARWRRQPLMLVSAGPLADNPALDDLTEALTAQAPDIEIQVVRTHADPAMALTEAGRQAELLVLGCYHSSDRFSARLGSVTATVLGQLPCPVLLAGQPS